MSKSKLGSEHIIARSYDADNESLKVTLLGAEIELNAKDGDSVLTLPETKVIDSEGVYDATGINKIAVYGPALISISPSVEGNTWFNVSTPQAQVVEICAMRIKVDRAGGSTAPLYVVTKSV